MGKAPAVIIIARHGARLDAEDKTWQETSATPYDPPLSYGGWTQTRALGARIASILRERDIALADEEINNLRRGSDHEAFAPGNKPNGPRKPATWFKRRKRKVIIHSSPFLRCIQSSIAISAGMAQYEGNLKKFDAAQRRMEQRGSKIFSTPARAQTLDVNGFDARYTQNGQQVDQASPTAAASPETGRSDFWKPTLRVDAFLGEWLSADYFEFITAPPSSKMMVAGAKADLMRRGTPLQGAKVADDLPQSPAHGWQNGLVNGATKRSSSVSFKLDDLAEALPGIKHDSSDGIAKTDHQITKTSPRSRHKSVSHGYAPPIPTYAISATEAIPPGFVAHARDSCIRLDFQWDSMREPQNWGDGGTYGEEWRSMHRRFRRGLMEMISWYKLRGPYFDPQADDEVNRSDESSEEGEETVVILVTHGAPCNALIGALTNQPVLMDVGMGSLTMALHKGTKYSQSPPPVRRTSVSSRRRSSVDVTQSEEYEMKVMASADHLRAGADPLKIPQLQSPHLAAIPEGARRSSASTSSGAATPEELVGPRNAALGSMRRNRATTLGSHRVDSGSSSQGDTGLWANRQATLVEPTETLPSRENSFNEDDEPPPPISANAKEVEAPPVAAPRAVPAPAAGQRTTAKGGLWGGGGAQNKDPVRRFTIAERT